MITAGTPPVWMLIILICITLLVCVTTITLTIIDWKTFDRGERISWMCYDAFVLLVSGLVSIGSFISL